MLDSGDQVWRKQSPEGRRRQLTAFLLPFEEVCDRYCAAMAFEAFVPVTKFA